MPKGWTLENHIIKIQSIQPLPHFQNHRFTGISNEIVIENLRTELSITGVRLYKNVASQITAGKINGEIYLGSA